MPNVLIADDEESRRALYGLKLGNDKRIHLTFAENPEQAVRLIRQAQEPFDTVVTDGFNLKGWKPVVKAAQKSSVENVFVVSGSNLETQVTEAGAQFFMINTENLFPILFRRIMDKEGSISGSREVKP